MSRTSVNARLNCLEQWKNQIAFEKKKGRVRGFRSDKNKK